VLPCVSGTVFHSSNRLSSRTEKGRHGHGAIAAIARNFIWWKIVVSLLRLSPVTRNALRVVIDYPGIIWVRSATGRRPVRRTRAILGRMGIVNWTWFSDVFLRDSFASSFAPETIREIDEKGCAPLQLAPFLVVNGQHGVPRSHSRPGHHQTLVLRHEHVHDSLLLPILVPRLGKSVEFYHVRLPRPQHIDHPDQSRTNPRYCCRMLFVGERA